MPLAGGHAGELVAAAPSPEMAKTRIKELGRGVSVPFDAECRGEFVGLLWRVGGGSSSDQFLVGLAWGGGEIRAVFTLLL